MTEPIKSPKQEKKKRKKSKKMKKKTTNKKRKKKKNSRKSSPPQLINFFRDSDSESDEEDTNQVHPSNDDVSTSSMPGLQERNREDSSSEDENSQQNPMSGLLGRGSPVSSSEDENPQQKKKNEKKKKPKKVKKKRNAENFHQWGKEANAHQAVVLEEISKSHDRSSRFTSDDVESDAGSEIPPLASRYDDDEDDDSSDSEDSNTQSNPPPLISRIDNDNEPSDSEDSDACGITSPPTKDDKEDNVHQEDKFEYRSNQHNRVSQYDRRPRYTSDSDSDNDETTGKMPDLCSRHTHGDDSSIDSEDSEVCLFPSPLTKHSRKQDHSNERTNTTKTTPTTTTNTSASTPDGNNDLIPGEIEIRTDGSHIFPQNDVERQMLLSREEDESAPIGGSMDMPKFPNMIRISGCNPNGINTSNVHSQLQHSLDLDIDIQCYSEVNANFMHHHIRQKFQEESKRSYQFSKTTWGTSKVESDSDFKAGGTGIVTRASCSTRVKKEATDDLGRRTYQILDGKGKRDVLIMSIYQCCTSKNKNETLPASKQQEILLSQMDRKDINPTRNFRKDIIALIAKLKEENDELIPIIVGDWNEECKGGTTSNELCNEFGLVNIFDHHYPTQKKFKTYVRGSRQIDFALAPRDIADRVINIVYEPFLYRLKGDHRAFYFDINEEVLFQNKMDPPFRVDGRGISSKDCKNVTRYLEAVNKHLLENNVFERMRRLMRSDKPNFLELERIDRDITQACAHGENCCRKRRLAYWSVDLHVAKRDLSITVCDSARMRKTRSIASSFRWFGDFAQHELRLGSSNTRWKDIGMVRRSLQRTRKFSSSRRGRDVVSYSFLRVNKGIYWQRSIIDYICI